MPKKLLVIGSGAIGVEFASFYNAIGSEVTVLEMQNRILLAEDKDVANYAQNSFEKKGIKLFDSKEEMKNWNNHYIKLEELSWIYGQDVPMPDGIHREREPFNLFMKDQIDYEKNYYGTEIVAVKDEQYIGSTDLEVFYKSEPKKAWTGSLGVLKAVSYTHLTLPTNREV